MGASHGCLPPGGGSIPLSPETDITELSLGLPATIQTIIESRCRATGEEARQILDLAAVIGRGFDYDLLKQASDLRTPELLTALDELLERQLIRERTEAKQAEYEFSHHKIREVIYQGLSQARHIHLHHQVAAALTAIYDEDLDGVAGRLARHDTEAGMLEKGVAYRFQAGQEALRLSAHEEAITHLTEGLSLLESLPQTPERAGQELELQMALGTALMAVKGYGAPALVRTHDRARELCRQVEDLSRLSLVLTRLWVYYLREHMSQSASVHYVITHGGDAPNIVPQQAEVWYFIRAPLPEQVEQVTARVRRIAEGAALMTDTRVEVNFLSFNTGLLNNQALADLQYAAMELVGPIEFSEEEQTYAAQVNAAYEVSSAVQNLAMQGMSACLATEDLLAGNYLAENKGLVLPASTDVGDLSWCAPLSMLCTTCWPVRVAPHTWGAVAASAHTISGQTPV